MDTKARKRTSLVLPEARANYAFVFKARPPVGDAAGGENSYSITLAFPKKADLGVLRKKILEVATEKWGDKALGGLKSGALRNPIRDGDLMDDPNFAGCWVVSARRKESLGRPGVVDRNVQPIIDETEFYSGCYCHASVSVFAYSNAGKGVGIGLNNLQKTRDGERLAGKPAPEEDFEALEPQSNDFDEDDDFL